jgi:chemotaxis protein MotB
VLDKVAEVIGGTAERVRVEGHTDDVPVSRRLKEKFTSNWELSAARAANVVRYFQFGKGIDPARMEAVGLGPYRPDAPNDSFEGRAQNRRVVIVLTAPPGEPASADPPPPKP